MIGDSKIFFLLSNVNLLNVHDVIDEVGNVYVDKVMNSFYYFVLLYIESYVMCNASKIIRKLQWPTLLFQFYRNINNLALYLIKALKVYYLTGLTVWLSIFQVENIVSNGFSTGHTHKTGHVPGLFQSIDDFLL